MIAELFKERSKRFNARCAKYSRYVFNDHFILVLLFLLGFVLVQYVSANNWAPSGKTLFEFSQFKGDNEFTTTQVSISSFNAEKTE